MTSTNKAKVDLELTAAYVLRPIYDWSENWNVVVESRENVGANVFSSPCLSYGKIEILNYGHGAKRK